MSLQVETVLTTWGLQRMERHLLEVDYFLS